LDCVGGFCVGIVVVVIVGVVIVVNVIIVVDRATRSASGMEWRGCRLASNARHALAGGAVGVGGGVVSGGACKCGEVFA